MRIWIWRVGAGAGLQNKTRAGLWEEAENTSVEEDAPPCEGGSDTMVSRYVPSRMVWINIYQNKRVQNGYLTVYELYLTW